MTNNRRIDGCLVTTAVDTDTIIKQIKQNNTLNTKNVSEMVEFRQNTPIAIVGGGPSLADTLPELRKFKRIMSCGSVHDYLVSNNIVANWCIICDPDPLVINYMKKTKLDTNYLIASQCHPDVFSHLCLNKKFIWHAGGDNFDTANFGENQTVIGGGCTIGTRAIVMALSFAYYDIHLFGFDTCLTDDYKHHAYDFNDPEKESLGNIYEIRLGHPTEGKKFKVAEYMLGQIFDFKNIIKIYNRAHYTVHGDGALGYILQYGIEEKEKLNGN